MPRFISINFYQNRPKIKLFKKLKQKIKNLQDPLCFRPLEALLLDPQNSSRSIGDFWLRAFFRRNVAAVARRWQHYVRLDRSEI